MRKPNRILFTALIALGLLATGVQATAGPAGAADVGSPINTHTDASGRITVTVFERVSGVGRHIRDHRVTIPDADMVAVGGGARATNQGHGALLTASAPLPGFRGWTASSKDHSLVQPHQLHSYVIGMKIAGMSAAQLRANLRVTEQHSGVAAHPEAEAPNPGSNNWLLLGGGFHVDWHGAGNLATASFPSSDNTWKARSKDHLHSDPSNLIAYGIFINRHLPVGQVQNSRVPAHSAHGPHPAQYANVADSFALTGGGAEVHWQPGHGNLLWQLEPASDGARGFRAGSKDHKLASHATLTAWALGLRML